MTRADRISATLLFLFSLFVIVEARALPYWTANSPGPGFLPFWLGVLLACASASMFARTLMFARPLGAGGADPPPDTLTLQPMPDRTDAVRLTIVVCLTAAAAALTLVIGLVLASAVFMGATLAYLRPRHARANWIAAVMTPVIVWLLFVRWLAVPLPAGLFGF
jgi:putative tricarboxylic transport membrane protein